MSIYWWTCFVLNLWDLKFYIMVLLFLWQKPAKVPPSDDSAKPEFLLWTNWFKSSLLLLRSLQSSGFFSILALGFQKGVWSSICTEKLLILYCYPWLECSVYVSALWVEYSLTISFSDYELHCDILIPRKISVKCLNSIYSSSLCDIHFSTIKTIQVRVVGLWVALSSLCFWYPYIERRAKTMSRQAFFSWRA